MPRLEGDAEDVAASAVEGAIMGLFEPDKYRTIDKEEKRDRAAGSSDLDGANAGRAAAGS